jgi:hypothetical protein
LLGLSASATSTTSNTIGTGSKSFTVQTGKGFIPGMSLSIARTAAPTNRMFCAVVSYDSGTGALIVISQAFEGSGTFTDWSIAPAYNGVVSNAQLSSSYINDLTTVTLDAATDFLAIADASDSGNKKKALLPLATNAEYVTGTTSNLLTAAVARSRNLVAGTSVSASGTSVDFTALPTWVKRITVMLSGVSTNSTSPVQLQIGSGSVSTSGYVANLISITNAANNGVVAVTTGFVIGDSGTVATTIRRGSFILTLVAPNIWSCVANVAQTDTGRAYQVIGDISLAGALDRVRITTVNGTDTFDAGSINIIYE